MRGTRVGRGLKSGPGEVAASSTRSDRQPAAQLPVALCSLAAVAAPRPGRVHARAPAPPRSPLAPPPASTLPTGGAEESCSLPAAENRHAPRQPASSSPWVPGTVPVQVEAGRGLGSGALSSAVGSRREGPSAAPPDARESREVLAPAGNLWPPRPLAARDGVWL